MEIDEIVITINNLLENKRISDLHTYLEDINKADFPEILNRLEEDQLIIIYRLLSKEKAAEVFVQLDTDEQERLISYLTDKEIKNVMNELYMDDAVDLIEEMPANVVKRILKNTKPEDRKVINELLKYPEDTAGSMMTTEFMDLKENMTVDECFKRIKRTGTNSENLYNCFVLTVDRKLLGIVDIKDLLIADRNQMVKDIMDTNVVKVSTLEDQEEVAKCFEKYDIVSMPVVDKEDRLVGIITIDDAIDVMKEETAEDFQKMAAINTTDQESYFKTSVLTHTKNRVVWLIFLMFSSVITGMIIQKYENAIAAIPLLVAFIPMIMGTGGNCGSQTSTLIIRGLAMDELSTKDVLKVIWKELRVSLLVGMALGLVNCIRIMIQYRGEPDYLKTSLVVSLALCGTVVAAKLIGGLLPLGAKKLKMDPAVMAAPLLTTIVDAVSISLYFAIVSFAFFS